MQLPLVRRESLELGRKANANTRTGLHLSAPADQSRHCTPIMPSSCASPTGESGFASRHMLQEQCMALVSAHQRLHTHLHAHTHPTTTV